MGYWYKILLNYSKLSLSSNLSNGIVFIVLTPTTAPYFFSNSQRSLNKSFWVAGSPEGTDVKNYSVLENTASYITLLVNVNTETDVTLYLHYGHTEDGLVSKELPLTTTITLPNVHNAYFPAIFNGTDVFGNDTPSTFSSSGLGYDGPIGSHITVSDMTSTHALPKDTTTPYTIIALCDFSTGGFQWQHDFWLRTTEYPSYSYYWYGSAVRFTSSRLAKVSGQGGSSYAGDKGLTTTTNGWGLAAFRQTGATEFDITKYDGSYVSGGSGTDVAPTTSIFYSESMFSDAALPDYSAQDLSCRVSFIALCTSAIDITWTRLMGASIFDTGSKSSFIYVDFQNSLLPPEVSPPATPEPLTTAPETDVALVGNLIIQSALNDVTFKSIIYNIGSYQNEWTVAGGSNVVNVWGYFEPMITGTYVSDNNNTDANDGRFFTFKEYMFQMHDKVTIRGIKYDVQAIQDRYIADNQIYKMLILKKQPIYYAACKGTVI